MSDELRFHDDTITPNGPWTTFGATTAGRGPLEYFHSAMEYVDGNDAKGRQAIDLGCGGGADSRALLARGWKVLAVDAEPGSERLLTAGLSPERRARLEITIGAFHEVKLVPADLVYAQFSLPFAGEHFEQSVRAALGAVTEGGAFVGQLFGTHDDWVAEEGAVVVDHLWVEKSLRDFAHVDIDERQYDAPYGTANQTRHFHFFHIRARR